MMNNQTQKIVMYEMPLLDSQAWGDDDDEESSGVVTININAIVSIKEIHQKYLIHKDSYGYRRKYASPTSGPFMYTEVYLNDGRSYLTLNRSADICKYLRSF